MPSELEGASCVTHGALVRGRLWSIGHSIVQSSVCRCHPNLRALHVWHMALLCEVGFDPLGGFINFRWGLSSKKKAHLGTFSMAPTTSCAASRAQACVAWHKRVVLCSFRKLPAAIAAGIQSSRSLMLCWPASLMFKSGVKIYAIRGDRQWPTRSKCHESLLYFHLRLLLQ